MTRATPLPTPDHKRARPFDWYRAHRPRSACRPPSSQRTALTRRRILIPQPAPGFHPQPAAKLTDDIAVSSIQHHIEQHPPRLILRRHHGQYLQQLSHRNPGLRLQRRQVQQPLRRLSRLPILAPLSASNAQARGSKYNPQDFTNA